MGSIFIYLRENSKECQFSLQELMNQIPEDYHLDVRIIKLHLQKFGNDIFIVEAARKKYSLLLLETGFILIENFQRPPQSDDRGLKAIKIADLETHQLNHEVFP